SADQLPEHALVRYVRIVNKTDKDQVLPAGTLVVKTQEVDPNELQSTTMGIHQYYGANDVRRVHNLGQLFDGDLNNFVEFSDYQHKDGEIVMKLGTTRQVKKIRAYIQDAERNYLRDGKIQVSEDGKNWTDVVTVGDGVENEIHDDSLTDGWT
ncbi:discoidin domain-containing protein, partial [Campylobacter jejuni]|nr:discoidin domain-containing protein [Campylobacter jejuni]